MENFHDDKMIFIVGVGRSGTTLVQSMMNAHRDICFTPETHFLRFYIASGKAKRLLRRKGLRLIEDRLKGDKYLQRLNLDLGNLFSSFYEEKEFSFVKFYESVLRKYAKSKGKTIIGDKDPRSIEYLPFINKYFPDARIINVVRDPRDVIASRMKANWSKGRNFYSHLFVYRVQFRLGTQEGHKLFSDRYQEVVYEDLLRNPEKTLKKVCKKLEIEYDPAMLDFGASAKELMSPDEMQWKKESLGPLLKNNVNKWEKIFSLWQVAAIERTCNYAFDYIGYKKNNGCLHLSWWQKTALSIMSANFAALEQCYRSWRRLGMRP